MSSDLETVRNDVDMTEELLLREATATEARLAPLLAVCGIAGGAGASTLAFLTAMYAQHLSSQPILLCDSGGPTASLAQLAKTSSQLSLPQAATAIGADALGVPLFAQVTAKLRLIARGPDFEDDADPAGLARLLGDARGAHPLTIVDCGTLQRPIERAVAEQASSILWVAPGSLSGVRRARTALQSLPLRAEREILAVRAGEERNAAVEHELMGAAEMRGAALVFVLSLPEIDRVGLAATLEAGQLALEAIRTRLT